jgi:hypothetical protein
MRNIARLSVLLVLALVSPVFATTELVSQGKLTGIRTGHVLVPMFERYVLDWEPHSGFFRLWRLDPYGKVLFADPPVREGHWYGIGRDNVLIPVGGCVIAWQPESGNYRLFKFDAASREVLVHPPIREGNWSSIRAGHVLMPIGNYVLDWEPGSGHYRVYRFDPHAPEPFPDPPICEGSWGHIRTGRVLMPVGVRYVFDWEPTCGDYRFWHFDPVGGSFLSGAPIREGVWEKIRTGYVWMPMGEFLLLWRPACGTYYLYRHNLAYAGPPRGPVAASSDSLDRAVEQVLRGRKAEAKARHAALAAGSVPSVREVCADGESRTFRQVTPRSDVEVEVERGEWFPVELTETREGLDIRLGWHYFTRGRWIYVLPAERIPAVLSRLR